MNWVSKYRYLHSFNLCSSVSSVKWLGKDAITALAVDGKGTKADLLDRVARWVAARGRNVTQPGTFWRSFYFARAYLFSSNDRIVRNSAFTHGAFGQLQYRSSSLR